MIANEEIHTVYKVHTMPTFLESSTTAVLNQEQLEFPLGLPPAIIGLLQQFQGLFRTPSGLPPHRVVDHKIHLLPNMKPVNIRPYRYPYFQKKRDGEISARDARPQNHSTKSKSLLVLGAPRPKEIWELPILRRLSCLECRHH